MLRGSIGGANGGGEHEPVLAPCLPEREAPRVLPFPVLAQVPDREFGQDDCSPGHAHLGLNDPQLAVGALQARRLRRLTLARGPVRHEPSFLGDPVSRSPGIGASQEGRAGEVAPDH